MKLMIEIPKETYDEVRHYGLNLCPRDKETLEKAFKTCKPLSENPTNGDIFKAMFPDVEYKIIRKLSGCDYIEVKLDNINRHQFELDWWNTPYKRGVEE